MVISNAFSNSITRRWAALTHCWAALVLFARARRYGSRSAEEQEPEELSERPLERRERLLGERTSSECTLRLWGTREGVGHTYLLPWPYCYRASYYSLD
jgi:hypothetical protein